MQYGLIGETLTHSISPKIHSLLGNKDYQCQCLCPHEVEDFIKNGDWLGLNVTIPYKETVLPFCDEVSPQGKAIGSVNTLIKKNGKIYGDNTDYQGFLFMAEKAKISFCNKTVTLLGNGGTGKMAKVAITDAAPKELTIVTLDAFPRYEDIEAYCQCEILVNTTPVGMYPNTEACLCNLDDFPHLEGVLDVIYNPLETLLLKQAKERSIPHSNGLLMLIEQARCAEEAFFGKAIAQEKTMEIYEKLRNAL